MEIEDIQLGGRYYHYFGKQVEVEGFNRSKTRPRVIARNLKNNHLEEINPRELQSPQDYKTEQERQKRQLQTNRQQARQLINAAGPGAIIDGKVQVDWVQLKFTEQAAVQLIEACGDKPPLRLPSDETSDSQKTRRATTLSLRLRRALKAGYAGSDAGVMLAHHGGKHQATIGLTSQDLNTAVHSLYGLDPEHLGSDVSQLSQLIA